MQSEALRSAKAQLSAAHRKDRNVSPDRLRAMKQAYEVAKLTDHIEAELGGFLPLTAHQNRSILKALGLDA